MASPTPRKKLEERDKRARRARMSNIFGKFDQNQIEEFKEAFNMIDQNKDGFIDKEDLHDVLASLGKNPTDEYLEDMLKEAPGAINFTMFLTLISEKISCIDPEQVILNAFSCFDETQTGLIPEANLREFLMTMGDRMTEEQVDDIFMVAPIKNNQFDFLAFTKMLKYGGRERNNSSEKLSPPSQSSSEAKP
ncbi:myosin regulatory light chain sqh-like [Apostichopus japonicus]|uniref:myosin regulatory light chain sqh-like n=1 Tax=Stichopus japonicus TaxID=307972 RepID=UPI003AB2CB97